MKYCLLLLLLGAVLSQNLTAAEPWADPALQVPKGLVLWLDAARENQAREHYKLPVVAGETALAIWHDASGERRHLVQRAADAQPTFEQLGPLAAVRFDGKDDYLGLDGLNSELKQFTALIVAAPNSNTGLYRALMAANARGRNDYTSGFNIDQSGFSSEALEILNFEGIGFQGAEDMLNEVLPFQQFHTIEVAAADKVVALGIDGRLQRGRPRDGRPIAMDELTLGARFYSNEPRPAHVQGHLDGRIAEVLMFDRVLSTAELTVVRTYLEKKYADIDRLAAGDSKLEILKRVEDPPSVQMFVPGFTVRELPVKLTNINNVRYRHDGQLYAMAYNGKVFLLSDRDGDGVEETVKTFWDRPGIVSPIGIGVTPPDYQHGQGLFVVCKGKVSLLVDRDNDDQADEEIVVTRGWKELFHSVDAMGVAVDKDGSLYFGLGTTNFTNAYLLDEKGRAGYDLASERGTILRVSPDFKSREIVCTGIRFPVAMAFNRHGDLFATDQEGATWLSNGNPFDELLHIQPKRHYGFPPRHPKHLPDVIDEPSVFDYRPQHQSTCGLVFNEPVNNGPIFGPEHWAGDALVCGESRGKLYRTKLVKTEAGYVAQNHLFAAVNMLTVDACVTPNGDLVVATHSGAPDWGTGPEGIGKLYKISYTDRRIPQPLHTWSAGPGEVRIAFDRELQPEHLQGLAQKTAITYGEQVAAGDRFESFRPGYAVVARQMTALRRKLEVFSVALAADRRTLVLATERHPSAVSYAVRMPDVGQSTREAEREGELPQVAETDLAYDLTGVDARWSSADGAAEARTWLPHFDLVASRELAKTAEHAAFWSVAETPGRLTLEGQLDLWQMLRPAVQPGDKIDYELPEEVVTVVLRGSQPFSGQLGDTKYASNTAADKLHEAKIELQSSSNEYVPLEVQIASAGGPIDLHVSYFTAEDSRERALQLSRVLLPWARREMAVEQIAPVTPPELEGGDWWRGRQVFASADAQCAKCHAVRGEGGTIGPDLSNLVHRDYTSVLRDIEHPSYAINPDFISYAVRLVDGRVLSGAVQTRGQNIAIGDEKGVETLVPVADVEEMKPTPVSTMPEGLVKTLGPQRMRDLLTFLLLAPSEELRPAEIRREGAPPPRPRSEVVAALAGSEPVDPAKLRQLKIVLVGGPKDHGVGEHDYPDWQERWSKQLALAEKVEVTTANEWPSEEDFKTADVLVWYSANPGWSPDRAKDLDAFLARGGGMVYLHFAVHGRRAPDQLAKRIGLAWQDGRSKFRHGALTLKMNSEAKHPITRNLDRVDFIDESYWNLAGDLDKIIVLATAEEEGAPRPLLWTREGERGRVFGSILGHYSWTFDDPLFRLLVLRGIAWSAGESVDRFNDLVTVGARIDEKK